MKTFMKHTDFSSRQWIATTLEDLFQYHNLSHLAVGTKEEIEFLTGMSLVYGVELKLIWLSKLTPSAAMACQEYPELFVKVDLPR